MTTPSSGCSSQSDVLTASLANIQVLGDITPCRLAITDVSDKHDDSIFRVEQSLCRPHSIPNEDQVLAILRREDG